MTSITALLALVLLLQAPAARAAAPAEYEPAKAALEERLARLRRVYNEIDWAATSPAELGRRLNHDPQACAAFLRRAVRYEPYAGVLRGGPGALAAGAGNSADLCLLLREMLAGAEPRPTFRFATAELDPAQAAKLVDAAVAHPPAGGGIVAAGANGAPDDAARPTELPTIPQRAAGIASLLDHAKADLKQIETALGDTPPRDIDDRDAAIQHARQHVWLQVVRDGKVETLDPVAALPLPNDAELADELPADWSHVLRVRLELERLPADGSGKPQREMVIEKRWPTAALGAEAIELVIAPAELSVDRLLDPKGENDSLAAQAREFEKYGVALGARDAAPEKLVSLTAKSGAAVSDAAEEKSAGPTGIGGGFDPFKRAGARGQPPGAGGDAAKPAAGAGDLSGLFVTFTLSGPDGTWWVERSLLDRVGPAARAARGTLKIAPAWDDPQRLRLALVQRHQILTPTGTVGMARVVRDAVGSIAEHRTLEQALALEHGKTDPAKAMDAVVLPSLPADLIAVSDGALSLTAMMALAGGGGADGALVYLGSPNLYLKSETLDLVEGQAVLRCGADLVRNEVMAVGPGADKARRAHGVLASELEGLSVKPPHGGVAPLWAADVLRAAAAANIPLRALRAPGDERKITADPDARAVMAALLAQQHVLLVPERPVPVEGATSGQAIAWWTIDDRGHALATGADGRGQAMGEGMMILTDISIPMVKRCMTFVACLNKSVAGGGAMRQSAGECLAQAIRDYVKDTLDSAIKQFITSPIQGQAEQAASEQFGEYWELYQKAKAAKERFDQAMSAIEDPAGQVPGVNEGREAADAGRDIGATLGFRMYLLLTMGSDIAEYASQP